MRLALVVICALLASGCLRGTPSLEVHNESREEVAGRIDLWRDPGMQNDTSEHVKAWDFVVPANSSRTLGKLPSAPRDYYHFVATFRDGQTSSGFVHSGTNFCDAWLRVLADRIEMSQCVI